jgi:hypothetical protein
MSERGTFGAFLRECRAPLGAAFLKLLIRLPLALLLAFVLFLLLNELSTEAGDQRFYRLSDFLRAEAWADLNTRLWTGLLIAYLVVLPIWGAQVLYLEWDKYKKDKPSGFTHDKGCEGPPGYVRRLKEVQSDSWALDGCAWPMQPVGEGRYRCEGDYSQGALLKQIRGKFVRHENKPLTDTEHDTLWRIRQNSGTEVHVHLKRVAAEPGEWHLQVQFFEWAGRRHPPVLAKDVVLEFKPLRL